MTDVSAAGYLVLVNPTAGRSRRTVERVAAALVANGVEHSIEAPSSIPELERLIADAHAAGRSRFVAVGGDGTVNAVVNALMGHDWPAPPVLGVLPAGTGCDLVRTFAIPQSIEGAAQHLAGDQTYLVDVAEVSGGFGSRHFLNVGQTGVAAAAVERAAMLPGWLGRVRYLLGFFWALPRFRRTTVVVEAGKRTFEGDALAVILANGQFFGGGFNVAPKATLVDGELDVQVLSASRGEAFRLVPRVARGLHLTHRSVRRFSTSEVRVSTAEPWPVEVDGDFVGNTPITARVHPSQIALKI